MTSINLGVQTFVNNHSLLPDITVQNIYFENVPQVTTGSGNALYRRKRPGVMNFIGDTTVGSILALLRPIGIFNNDLFTVEHGLDSTLILCRTNSTGSKTVIGSVSSYPTTSTTPNIKMIYTQFGIVVLNDGHELYVYTTAGSLQQIIVPESYVPQDIATINNYLMIGCTTGRVYYLEPNEWVFTDDNASGDDSGNTDSALNYFTAESLPDGLVSIQNLRGQLYIFGQLSTEIWQVTGDSTSPFTKALGLDLMKGAMDRRAVALFDNTIVWIGQDSTVYRVDSIPIRISTFNIEAQIKASSSFNFWTYTLRGHLFLVIDLDNYTFQYDAATKMWNTLKSYNGGVKFGFTGYQDLNDVLLFTGSDRNIHKFDTNTYQDNSNPIECKVSGYVETILPIQIKNLCLTTSQSGATNYSITWRNAYDTQESNPRVIATTRSDMTRKMMFQVGQVVGPYKEFTITTTDNTDINIIDLSYNQPIMYMNR